MEEEVITTVDENGKKTTTKTKTVTQKSVEKGISFGSALAMVISFCTWKSVGWAIVHGLFSWAYVIYYIIKY